jgi:hypothetical protein
MSVEKFNIKIRKMKAQGCIYGAFAMIGFVFRRNTARTLLITL